MKQQNGHPFRQLHGRKKIQYLWDYYKFHFVVAGILLYIPGYLLYGHLTHREPVFYAAFVNVVLGDTLTRQLSDGFLEAQHLDPDQYMCYLYPDLCLTEGETGSGRQYVYASGIKIMGSIDAGRLDLVFMDQEALSYFLEQDALCDLETLIPEADPALYRSTESGSAALDLSHTPFIQNAGFPGPVYLGVLANSPRKETASAYIRYLFSGAGPASSDSISSDSPENETL